MLLGAAVLLLVRGQARELHRENQKEWSVLPIAIVLAMVLSGTTLARAQSFEGLGFLPAPPGFFISSSAFGVSADGSAVTGNADVGGGFQAFRWTADNGMTALGTGIGGSGSQGLSISGDGAVIVGDTSGQAMRWTAATGIVGLGFLPNGFLSQAHGVNFDGSVVVGLSNNRAIPGDGTVQAFRWTKADGMSGLGYLPGNNTSRAMGTNADGSVVVGDSGLICCNVGGTGANLQAFRWTATSGMVGLGFLPGRNMSFANGVSADGSVVVGTSGTITGTITNPMTTSLQAFRWMAGSGMVGLGFLPGDNASQAMGVSADGKVVVGPV
jgi:probable HAF family extracellular repeat protein